MGQLTTRRLLKCLAVPLIVAQVGCAARAIQVSPTPSASSVREQDRETCVAVAKREAKGVYVKSVAEESARIFAQGLVEGNFILAVGRMVLAPILGIGEGVRVALENHSVRKHAYTAAEETCLKPMILTESLGPKHPHVAAALRDLANRYATLKDHLPAERLYRRALDIQERALGPESAEVAITLDVYADLLRAMRQEEQATDLKARAEMIRANAERSRVRAGAAGRGTEGRGGRAAGSERPDGAVGGRGRVNPSASGAAGRR